MCAGRGRSRVTTAPTGAGSVNEMIHTIIGLEDIFGEGYGAAADKTVTECVGNGFAEYSVTDGKKTLKSFFSTRPGDYLGNGR